MLRLLVVRTLTFVLNLYKNQIANICNKIFSRHIFAACNRYHPNFSWSDVDRLQFLQVKPHGLLATSFKHHIGFRRFSSFRPGLPKCLFQWFSCFFLFSQGKNPFFLSHFTSFSAGRRTPGFSVRGSPPRRNGWAWSCETCGARPRVCTPWHRRMTSWISAWDAWAIFAEEFGWKNMEHPGENGNLC